MKRVALLISILCLLLSIVPSLLVYFQTITPEANKALMLIGTIGWFITAPFWMNKQQSSTQEN
jgi:hypothetical protein